MSISQLQKEQLCWKPLHVFCHGAGLTRSSEARKQLREAQHTPDTGLGTQKAQRPSLLSVAKGTFLTEHNLGSPSTFTNSEMPFSWHTLGHFVPSQQCTGAHASTINSPCTQKVGLAWAFLTIYSSGSRNWDCEGSAETPTFKVLTSHFPLILLETIALRCCSRSPHLPRHTQ